MSDVFDSILFLATLGLSLAGAFVVQKTALQLVIRAMARR